MRTKDCYFGVYPVCGYTDGYINNGAEHWFVCDVDLTKWYIGTNLFSDWKDETELEQRRSKRLLSGYVQVESVRPEQDPDHDGGAA